MRRVDFPIFVEVWNRDQGLTTPAHHHRIATWLERRWRGEDRRLLLMAFRNSGKSTLVGLFAAWLLVENADLRILVLAADGALARKMVRNTKRILERHRLAAGLRPEQADEWAADRFTVARAAEWRDPSMLARGIGANLTGSRADLVICDDVEVPNTCDSAVKRMELRERLGEIDFILTPQGTQLYVGTPHTYYTVYAEAPRPEAGERAAFLDGFQRLVLPVLGTDGSSAWPERFPADRIAEYRRRHGENRFSSQMQLVPVNIAESRLDPDRLRCYDLELTYREAGRRAYLDLDGHHLVSASCCWDPAFDGGRAGGRGDGSVIAAVFCDADGNAFVHRVTWLNRPDRRQGGDDADEATRQCREVADFLDALHLPSVLIEINGLGRFLPGLLRRELARRRVPATVRELANHRGKDQRILEAFDSRLAAGALFVHRTAWTTPLITEMREWQPGSGKGHDDGLDAVACALLNEPVRIDHGAPAQRRPEWRPGLRPVQATDAFVP